MNLEKTIADQVRALPDKQLADMALKAGFSLKLSKPNGPPRGHHQPGDIHYAEAGNVKKPRAPRKPKMNVSADASQASDALNWIVAKLKGAATDKRGLSTADIAKETGIDKGAVAKILKKLVADDIVFKGGDRRFTRYATSQKLADDASIAARGG